MCMKTHLTKIAAVALLGAVLGAMLGTARADTGAAAEAFAAQAALSARYTELWTRMPADARPEFARTERRWLHVQRWEEQQRCRSEGTAAASASEIADRCLAQVTLQRLSRLRDGPPPAAAGGPAGTSIAAR
jgi:hypothetical protein